MSPELAAELRAMLVDTTVRGTARSAFRKRSGRPLLGPIRVAGKTGSLTGKRAPSYNYNWFIGYAPAENPEMAFAVLLANEPSWRIKAHYAGRRIVQIYMERRDAIRRARDARLSREGVIIPARDQSTGALLADGEKPTTTNTPAPAEPVPLPPVPGARPTDTPPKQKTPPTPPTLPTAG